MITEMRDEDGEVLSSFELSECALSDHILDFGHYMIQNLDYFGDTF